MISKMKSNELKTFLRLRGLKTTGRKEELVARVFVAIENDVPIVKTAEESERENLQEYNSKLSIDGSSIPDPFQLRDGWLEEASGVRY